jgi:hypothetical protein
MVSPINPLYHDADNAAQLRFGGQYGSRLTSPSCRSSA